MIGQYLGALKYLNDEGYMHRDLKPENTVVVSLQPIQIIVIDFGSSTLAQEARSLSGTRGYWAPEVKISGRFLEYHISVDLYSIGAIGTEIVGYKLPPDIIDSKEDYEKIVGAITLRAIKACSSDDKQRLQALSMFQKMLCYHPHLRPSVNECFQLLKSWEDKSNKTHLVEKIVEVTQKPVHKLAIPSAAFFDLEKPNYEFLQALRLARPQQRRKAGKEHRDRGAAPQPKPCVAAAKSHPQHPASRQSKSGVKEGRVQKRPKIEQQPQKTEKDVELHEEASRSSIQG